MSRVATGRQITFPTSSRFLQPREITILHASEVIARDICWMSAQGGLQELISSCSRSGNLLNSTKVASCLLGTTKRKFIVYKPGTESNDKICIPRLCLAFDDLLSRRVDEFKLSPILLEDTSSHIPSPPSLTYSFAPSTWAAC